MSILDLQRRLTEIGRIRTGSTEDIPNKPGKRRPVKLDTFRLTSASLELIGAAAERYGGTPRPWQSPAGPAWEVVLTTSSLPILVPPGPAVSQWWELWSGGGCERRCTGERELLGDTPCRCPADPAERQRLAAEGKACKPTTRLNVLLPELPGLGVWRLEAHGYYAAVELGGTAEFLAQLRGPVQAVLRLDQRERRTPRLGVRRYTVPVIELPGTRLADLLELRPLVRSLDAPSARPLPSPTVETGPVGEGPLDTASFAARVREHGVDPERVLAERKRRWPDAARVADLTDDQRGELWEAIR